MSSLPFATALAAVSLALTWALALAVAAPPGRITGIGGVFVVSKDPKALAAWYRDVLGVSLEAWGGAIFHADAAGHPTVVTWNAFPEGEKYLTPSQRDFMLDLAVDDLDAVLARLQAKGVTILGHEDSDPASSPGSSIQTARRSSCGSR